VDVFDKRWVVWDMIREIKNKIYDTEIELPVWRFKKVEYLKPNKYKLVDKGIIKLGDRWDESFTYFFDTEFTVPKELEGKNIYLYMDIGGESEIYINGKAFGSIDFGHSHVHITDNGKTDNRYTISVQAAYHAQEYVKSKRMYGKPYQHHIFKDAKIVSKNSIVEELYYISSLLFDISVLEEDEKIKDNIFRILKDSLYKIEYHGEGYEFIKSIKKVKNILVRRIKELKIPKKYGKMVFAGHSHLDLAFKWTINETIRKIERTMSNTYSTLKRHPEGVFIHSQAQILEYLKEYYPELFNKVYYLIDNDRIELIGNTWTEFDSNIPSGESIIRQFLYGKSFYNQYFNKESRVCFLPDTFGFSGILPQILKKSGFEYFVTSKLNWNDTNKFPYNYFLWEGIDGTKIKSYLMPKGYGGDISFSAVLENYKNSVERIKTILFLYGAGDGGGGINDEMMQYKKVLKEINSFVEVKDDSIENCMKEIDNIFKNPNVYSGELYLERHRGTYTSQGKIKKYNRKCEVLYRNVEFFSILAEQEGIKYPKEEILDGWKIILLNQFHDIIAGSCITRAIREAWEGYEKAISIGNNLLERIKERIITEGNDIVVWNTLSWDRTDIVKLHIPNRKTVILDGSEEIDYQIVGEDENGLEVIATIRNIPSFGYRRLTLKKVDANIEKNDYYLDDNILENKNYRILFDEYGQIASILDKQNSVEVLDGKGNILEAFIDRSGYFDSWDISADFEKRKILIKDLKDMKLIERGPIKWTMKVVKGFKKSTITQYISIYRDIRRIDFKTEIDFHEPQILLKAGFEVNVKSNTAVYDLSMGSIERPTTINTSYEKAKYEVPAHKWVDLSHCDYGVSILNDCKYGYDIKGNRMRITLLKTGIYPDNKQDIGKHSFTYSLYPHKGDFREGEVVKAGYELNNSTIVMYGSSSKDRYSFIRVNTNSVIVEHIKKAEKDDSIIVRLYESKGIKDYITLEFDFNIKEAYKCDMMENEIEKINISNNKIHLHLNQYEIYTLKLKKI
jgi:alpha-mannosidase